MKRCVVSGAWVLTLIGLLAVATRPLAAQDDDVGIAVGATPPAATLQDLAGAPAPLAAYVGKRPVLLEFWATWCPICAELLPKIEAAHTKYADRVDFVVVAVGVNETRASVQRQVAAHPMPFTFLWDGDGAAVRAYQAPATSFVVVLDAKGKVAYTGMGSDQDIEAALRRVVP